MGSRNSGNRRHWLAEQAARWMSEHAIDDPLLALRRVLAREGSAAPDRRLWPDAEEIRAALQTYQRLFRGSSQARALHVRRKAALEAMRFFAAFRPCLVGAVLDGTADAHSPILLHLHADEPEGALAFLRENDIPHRLGERTIRLDAQRQIPVPCASFQADGLDWELWILPANCERSAPLECDGSTPMRRANAGALQRLVSAPDTPSEE